MILYYIVPFSPTNDPSPKSDISKLRYVHLYVIFLAPPMDVMNLNSKINVYEEIKQKLNN